MVCMQFGASTAVPTSDGPCVWDGEIERETLMRKMLLGAIMAIALITGLQGAAFAATPDATTLTVRQTTTFIENFTENGEALGNMPEDGGDNPENE